MNKLLKIKKVELFKLWGKYDIATELFEDDNVFIGKNGSGKTTFINIIRAILVADIEKISKLQFKNANIYLEKKNEKVKIRVEKKSANGMNTVKYTINNKEYIIENVNFQQSKIVYLSSGNKIIEKVNSEQLEKVKLYLDQLLEIRNISVHRGVYEELRNEYKSKATEVDSKLKDLMHRLSRMIYEKSALQKNEAKKFEEEVLLSILYDDKLDSLSTFSDKNNWEKERLALIKAYRGLGILNEEVEEKINNHIVKLKEASNIVDKELIKFNDIMPLTLFNRTQHIVNLFVKMEQSKQLIYKPINNFLEVLNGYFDDKVIELDEERIELNEKRFLKNTLIRPLIITKDGRPLDISQLSSGEKQLIILLTETLLQEKQNVIFIADEPELSLHITWQAKILKSIRKLNKNAQLIVATHSPEIAGSVEEISLIDMEDIING